jgi:hypothetical protein
MVAQAEGYEKNFPSSRPAIFEWHLLLSVLTMNGVEAGRRLCNIASPATDHSMATQSVICF